MNTNSSSTTLRGTTLATACGLGLMLALPAQGAGQGPDAWRDFARRSLTPDYSWNDAPAAEQLAPSLRDTALAARGNAMSVSWRSARSSLQHSFTLSFDRVPGAMGATTAPVVESPDLQTRLTPLHSRLLDATYEQDLGVHGRFGVSALVAQQQYATPGFGMLQGFQMQDAFVTRGMRGESSVGHGVRLDYRLPVGERLAWRWSAQSRVEMNALESLHGIYAEPGDFDLPARFGAQAEWQARDNLALALGVERVYFSQVTPFTSPALPARLLSLMADGSAPDFAWQDLTVYSVEGRLSDRWQGEWSLRYSTRQQPSPSAALYRQALASEYTNTNIALGYRHGLRHWGEVRLTASYAPSMAFLGPGPVFAARTYTHGAIGEFEASWVMPF